MQATDHLTTGAIPRTLFGFVLPILMGNILQSLNGSINSIWVGTYLGTAALTAANNANIVQFLLLGAVFGITMAASILVAQHIGARRVDEAREVVGTAVTFFLVLSISLAVLGAVFSRHILEWMETPPDALPFAVSYMRWMFVALPFAYGAYFVGAALRGAGDSKTPFRFLILSVALDIVCNPLFIFGWGPVPAMGIAGSAMATLVAQAVSLFALLIHIYRVRSPLALHRHDRHLLRMRWHLVKTLVLKGIPMGLQMIVMSVSMVLYMQVVNRFGSDTAAAYAAGMQLWNYIQMPAFALGAAVSSMAAQNIGAGLWERVRETTRVALGFNLLFSGLPVVLLYLFDRPILALFLPPGSPAIDIAHHIDRIVLWSFPLFGITMVLSGVVRAAGAVMAPLLILVATMLGFRATAAFWVVAEHGADGVWWVASLTTIVGVLLTTAYYLFGNWRSARMDSGRAAAV
jgi:putative MATE family efflux protein